MDFSHPIFHTRQHPCSVSTPLKRKSVRLSMHEP